MKKNLIRQFPIVVVLMVALAGVFFAATYAAAQENAVEDNLPLPRFVSIKAPLANMRVGPGRNYSIAWTYKKRGIPVEITQQYDNWRKIRDSDGDEGWLYSGLLSSDRTAIITPWQKDRAKHARLLDAPDDKAALVAEVEPGVLASIRECDGNWCQLDIGRTRGWISQQQIWGAYPGEKIGK